jgi:hypothetical protein
MTLSAWGQAACPNPPVPSVSSSAVPADVCVPANLPGNPIAFFDDYSWKAFIALVWPALAGQRGTPDPNAKAGGSGPLVFETYKSLDEVFHTDGTAPSAWNSFDPPAENPCNIQTGFNDMVLAAFSKYSNLGQAGFGALVGPLIAQNRTYVRFMTGFDQTEFNQILSNNWYLRTNLPAAGLTFNTGSLDVKSSWMEMTGVAHPERYYTRTAWVMDPANGKCSQKTVGLVGLHIVQKTPSGPQWIWSTFEQIDNVPPGSGMNFNDGSGTPMPTANPYTVDPLPLPTPKPYNVTRVRPIHDSTRKTNTAYQSLLANTPWRYYQLVMTQWPLVPNSPATFATPQNTFPGNNATTAFANTTMETFDQTTVFTGCMGCHAATQTGTDLVWALKNHAFPSNIPAVAANPQFRQLQSLLALSKTPAPKKK